MAHHCYVPMYTLNAPASANWLVFSAEAGAAEIAGYEAECDAAAEAGYDALEAAGCRWASRSSSTSRSATPRAPAASSNPNGANGKGLEYFGAGSTLADEMVMTWIEAASAHDC